MPGHHWMWSVTVISHMSFQGMSYVLWWCQLFDGDYRRADEWSTGPERSLTLLMKCIFLCSFRLGSRPAVWLKINLEKLVCTLVSWPMFQVTVALPSGYSEKFSIEQSSTVGDLRRPDTCPPDTWYELHPSVALLRWPRQRWLHCDCVNMGRPVCKSVCV